MECSCALNLTDYLLQYLFSLINTHKQLQTLYSTITVCSYKNILFNFPNVNSRYFFSKNMVFFALLKKLLWFYVNEIHVGRDAKSIDQTFLRAASQRYLCGNDVCSLWKHFHINEEKLLHNHWLGSSQVLKKFCFQQLVLLYNIIVFTLFYWKTIFPKVVFNVISVQSYLYCWHKDIEIFTNIIYLWKMLWSAISIQNC